MGFVNFGEGARNSLTEYRGWVSSGDCKHGKSNEAHEKAGPRSACL